MFHKFSFKYLPLDYLHISGLLWQHKKINFAAWPKHVLQNIFSEHWKPFLLEKNSSISSIYLGLKNSKVGGVAQAVRVPA
jgi:hypothetical protein